MKRSKKEIMAELEHQTYLAQAGKILAGKLFSHLIDTNAQLAAINGVERHYGDVQSHIDFHNRMKHILLTRQREFKVTIEGKI
jgi:hypothetical protein